MYIPNQMKMIDNTIPQESI